MKKTELKVINTRVIDDCDYAGLEPPEFTYSGPRAPKEMPKSLVSEFRAFQEDCEDGLPRKFYALVLRNEAVRAVEIASLEDLAAVTGPYFGFKTIAFFGEQDEANGLGEAGDECGAACGLFIHDRGAMIIDELVAAAVEGTKAYSHYIGPAGLVRDDPDTPDEGQ
jgi:hypothetical protein